MKCVNYLVTRLTSARSGNHDVLINGKVRRFLYFGNTVCVVNDESKTFYTDNCGWKTPSTTRVINEYKKFFKNLGYKDMEEMKNEIINA